MNSLAVGDIPPRFEPITYPESIDFLEMGVAGVYNDLFPREIGQELRLHEKSHRKMTNPDE